MLNNEISIASSKSTWASIMKMLIKRRKRPLGWVSRMIALLQQLLFSKWSVAIPLKENAANYLLSTKSADPGCDVKNTHSVDDRHFVTCRSFPFWK